MRRKTGEPKLKALRRMPTYAFGMRQNPALKDIRHPAAAGGIVPNGPTVMSMFCGCGGMDLGFTGGFRFLGETYTALPFNIAKALDIDGRAIETYRLNIGDHGEVGDLISTPASALPRCRVLIGGFPCQDFSSSGPKVGFAGDRGQLYTVLVRYMREHQPDMVIGENVPHLATLHGGQYLAPLCATSKLRGTISPSGTSSLPTTASLRAAGGCSSSVFGATWATHRQLPAPHIGRATAPSRRPSAT
jgi:DNA (cytosine-5)-methyltransferase 1